MPHLVIEYSRPLEDKVVELLPKLHTAIGDQPGMDLARTKTRAIPLDHYYVGTKGSDGLMLHGTLRILDGRDLDTKRQYMAPLFKLMKEAMPEGCSVTLDVKDTVRATYCT